KWAIFEPDGKKLLEEVKRKNLAKEADFNGTYGYTKMLKDQIKGKNNSWAIRWYFSAFLRDMLTLYPGKSYVKNIGFDFNATHTKNKTEMFDVELNQSFKLEKVEVLENIEARRKIEVFFKSNKQSFTIKLLNKLKSLI
ncbi:MAG TPA: glycosyltransferase family 2 protein, partial [Candidatus Paceibacterota bacterium]|nr:glycosyltransferase family 2 protein [Candidatus Paceibacterota bacterium]